METILIFIDGTICDTRHRHPLYGTPEFDSETEILKDEAVPDSVNCINELSGRYKIIYMGARLDNQKTITEIWLKNKGYPAGEVYLSEDQSERLRIARKLKEQNHIIAGIGDRWDDNELHLEIGCRSIILKEFAGNWNTVRKHVGNL